MRAIASEIADPQPDGASRATLYDSLGGRECLDRVHQRFYDKVFHHPVLGAFFSDKDQQHQESQQGDFMTAQFGGPKRYGGRLPDGAHQHMFITEKHFALRQAILAETLEECGVAPDLRDQWLAVDARFKRQIVKKSIGACVKRYTTDRIIVAPGA